MKTRTQLKLKGVIASVTWALFAIRMEPYLTYFIGFRGLISIASMR